MADINSQLTILKNAIYGEEMRSAIINAFNALNSSINADEKLMALPDYPNTSVNCMKYSCNFSNSVVGNETWKNVNPTAGDISVPTNDSGFDNVIKMELATGQSGGLGTYGRLTKTLSLDGEGNRTMLIKIRAMLVKSTSAKITIAWRLNFNGEIITNNNIVASNSNMTNKASWSLTKNGEWTDLWAVVKSTSEKTINDVGIFVSGTNASIYVSHFKVFYSLD